MIYSAATQASPVVVVTGGFGGLGLAMAAVFVSAGWKVALLDFVDTNRAEADEILAGDGITVVCDVSSRLSCDSAIKTTVEALGRVDALVNGAGMMQPLASHLITDSHWDLIVDSHARGTMHMSNAALTALLLSPHPSIVNISSVGAAVGMPGRLAYNAAKSAIESITRTLASEWGRNGIRVNAIAPGFIMTAKAREMYQTGFADASFRSERTSLGRLGEPSEIASVVHWLSSPAASYVSGAVIPVDGGFLSDGRTGEDNVSPTTEELIVFANVNLGPVA